jgi:FkbM family methyltransferase
MAIQRVALIYDDQARPDTTGVYCRRALGKLAEVEHFLPADLDQVPRRGFDLYLNIDDGLEYRLPSDLRPCAFWAIDTHLRLPWYLQKAPDFDLVFTAQKDGAEQLRQGGIPTATWLPLACDPDLHSKHMVAKQYDVCFVGHLFPGPRAELLELLQKHFPSCYVGQRFFEEMARTYSASRIVFNRSLRNDVNMRVFEALACGSLLLTNDLAESGQEELFRGGVHLATYQDAEELLYKATYYLGHEAEREKVAAAGRAEVLARHTYLHRMQTLLEEVERGLARPTAVVTTAPVLGSLATGSAVPPVGQPPTPTPAEALPLPNLPPPAEGAAGSWTAGLLEMVPAQARAALVFGWGADELKKALNSRGLKQVTAVAVGAVAAEAGDRLLDRALARAVERRARSTPALFDVLVCAEVLEHLHDPVAFLRAVRGHLAPGGLLLAAVPNVRGHEVLSALLGGSWPFEPGGLPGRTPLRFFTHHGFEKALYRAGLGAREVRLVPGAGHAGWVRQGRPGEVRAGRLHVGGLAPHQAEEFYTGHFLARATPDPVIEHGLTSIVIPTHNELACTRLCLDSIRRFTDEPYELIVVDNGSSDGTAQYLRSQEGVKVIANPENRGFPAACNQGLRQAKGRQLLLLNNDTVVTTGWLRRQLRALHSDPRVGLAGPCSNCVSGEQQVPVTYEDLSGLDDFAWDWGLAHDGELTDTDRLIGFCLLLRREVLDRVGLFDERFGIGNFEDDDYCRRALRAGYRAVIACDAFVHHEGGRTFLGSGIDLAALLERNQELFREKWAGEAQGKLPPAPTGVATAPASPKCYGLSRAPGGGLLLTPRAIHLSLCMIVRDNARTLAACLQSIRPWVDEMVVVDTGSRDETPEIARRLGARVFHMPWPDSFAAARNESLKYARGRWVFWMDSDDTIDAENGRKLRELALGEGDPSVLGHVVQVHCPGPGPEGEADVTVVDHVKLFRNLPGLRFERRIHEQIIPAIRRAGGQIAWSNVFVVHTGYDHSPEGQKRKLDRDLHLLNLELAEEPDHPFTLFNLGMTHADTGRHAEAVGFLRRSIAHSGPGESHLRKAYALLAHSLQQMGGTEEAWHACREGLTQFPQDAELLFRQAGLLQAQGKLAEAVRAYEELFLACEERHFSSVVRGLQGHLARHNLAVGLTDLGELARAEEQWRRVVGEAPRYRPGWRGLGESLLAQGKLDEAAGLAQELQAGPLRVEGLILQGQVAAARGELAKARQYLEEAVRERPEDDAALQALCRFLFERGSPGEAEGPLRQLLKRHPEDGAAHHNLGTACLQQGRPEEAATAYRASLQHRPDYAATYVCLGHALHACGRPEEAARAWQEGLRLEPGNREARQALEQLGAPQPGPKGGAAAALERHKLGFQGRTVELPFATRGPVDRAILHEVWDRDAYGVQALAEPPATVVDIGAHLGAFTLLAAECWPGARVLACEADPGNFALLQQNLRDRPQVEALQVAVVGEEVTEVDFRKVVDKAARNSGGGSCVRDEPGTVATRVAAVSAVRLWAERKLELCDLLKLDCEGSEVPVLHALSDAGLLGGVQLIVGEWHAREATEWAREQVKEALRSLLEATHEVTFAGDQGGREGRFTARRRPDEVPAGATQGPPALAEGAVPPTPADAPTPTGEQPGQPPAPGQPEVPPGEAAPETPAPPLVPVEEPVQAGV